MRLGALLAGVVDLKLALAGHLAAVPFGAGSLICCLLLLGILLGILGLLEFRLGYCLNCLHHRGWVHLGGDAGPGEIA